MSHELFAVIHLCNDDDCEELVQAILFALSQVSGDELHYALEDDVLLVWRVHKRPLGFTGG